MFSDRHYEAIVIGMSAGGVSALSQIFKGYTHCRIPVIVVQHVSPDTTLSLVNLYKTKFDLNFEEADEKESIQPGTIYFAPPNYHLLIEKDKTFSLSISEKINFSRPSIDVLFETAADAYGEQLTGVVLTGANCDGAQGLKRIKQKGGLAIIQDPLTAEESAMPKAALKVVPDAEVLSLREISDLFEEVDHQYISIHSLAKEWRNEI